MPSTLTELTSLKHFVPDPKWISSVLGITVNEVQDAVRRLKALELLEITEDGTWRDLYGRRQ
ncbi:MAG: DUF4423 domain-containing protein [Bdellovibrionales bacterium]